MKLTPEQQEQKDATQFKMGMQGILAPLDLYGQGIYFHEIIEQSMELAILYYKRRQGSDVQLTHEAARARVTRRSRKKKIKK